MSPLEKRLRTDKTSPNDENENGDTPTNSNTNADPSTASTASSSPPPSASSEPSIAALQSTRAMCYYCFDVLIHSLRYGKPPVPHDGKRKQKNRAMMTMMMVHPFFVSDLPDATVECPIFVTWDKECNNNHSNKNRNTPYQLRGCIGTLGPRLLVDAVGEYALISALKDRRFQPVTLSEIPSLRVSVSLLVQYEPCRDAHDWTVGVHGIMIKFEVGKSSYSATYLPEVAKEQQWTIPQAVASLVQKAGYHGALTPELFQNIQCTRYQSSKCQVTFAEYMGEHCRGTNPLTVALPSSASGGVLVSGDDDDDDDASGVKSSWNSCKQM